MASVSKRRWEYPEGSGLFKEKWIVRYFDVSGKHRQKTFDKKKPADAWLFKLKGELNDGIHVAQRDTVTVAQAADAWLRDCDRRRKIGDMTGQTIRGYQDIVRLHIVAKCGGVRLTELTALQIQNFINATIASRGNLVVARKVVSIMRMIIAHAVSQKWLRHSVMVDEPVKLPKLRQPPMAIPSKDDIRAILEAMARRRFHEKHSVYVNSTAGILLGMFCGMRRGEILGLQWGNVDFAQDVIRVRNSLSRYDGLKGPKTSSGIRDIPMPLQVKLALLQVLRYQQIVASIPATPSATRSPESARQMRRLHISKALARDDIEADIDKPRTGYVLATDTGAPLGLEEFGQTYLGPILKDAGLTGGGKRITVHSLRHIAASLMIEGGLPPMHLKAVIGHAKVATTFDVYGHLFPEDGVTRAVIDRMSGSFSFARLTQDIVSD